MSAISSWFETALKKRLFTMSTCIQPLFAAAIIAYGPPPAHHAL
jgi:hypothetical protein